MSTSVTLTPAPFQFLQLLGHEIRWKLLTALAITDLHVQELIEKVGASQNLVSYHLKQLRQAGLVQERRSIADGREIYYSLDLERMRALYLASGEELHPALGAPDPRTRQESGLLEKPAQRLRVLFLCTHNSARSQIAEAILRQRTQGKVEVFSAGTEPARVHPLALRVMQEHNLDTAGLHSKSMEQFTGQKFDYVITVCDRAKEACPVFPGDPLRIHWSFPDPAEVTGSEAERYQAFAETARQMLTRISFLLLMMKRTHGLDLE
jgi:protein-tyrosine-phosphatase/DNA-binding transcriptional ArsR family regulator